MPSISEARYVACRKFPYLSHGLISLIPIKKDGIGTLATSESGVMLYDPKVETWPVDELAGGLVHEVMHLILNHFALRKEFSADPMLWNLAGDLVINQMITAGGCTLVAGAVMPHTFNFPVGLNVHEYYTLLQKQAKKIKVGVCCGSAAGNTHPKESLEDQTERGKAEIESIKRQVAADIKASAAKNAGTIPGDLARWADAMLSPPKIPWQQKLRALARQGIAYQAGKVDLKWGAPSRRQWGIGMGPGKPILPTFKAPVPRVAIAIDTSGSMSQNDLIRVVSECKSILKACGAFADLVVCDAAIHEHKKISNVNEIKKSLKGGGGTDFVPVFEALEKNGPDILVFATDGYGPAPHFAPRFKTIWLLIGNGAEKPYSAQTGDRISWGEVVKVDSV